MKDGNIWMKIKGVLKEATEALVFERYSRKYVWEIGVGFEFKMKPITLALNRLDVIFFGYI